MQHIPLKNRNQYEFENLGDLIEQNNILKFLDAFVDELKLSKLGYTQHRLKSMYRISTSFIFYVSGSAFSLLF